MGNDDSLPPAFIDRDGPDAHRQLTDQLIDRIAIGILALKPGDRLPTVAEMKRSSGISHGTTMRSYNDLGRIGATEGNQKRGTRVRSDKSPAQEREIITVFATNRLLPVIQGLRRLGVPRTLVERATATAIKSAYENCENGRRTTK